MSEKNIFEKIIDGELPCIKIYEDDHVLAFLDIHPVNPGHTLVIPKHSSTDIFDMPVEVYTRMHQTVHALAPQIMRAVQADGINIIMNNKAPAGQVVFHPHVHIVPRFIGDELQHWGGNEYASPNESATIAQQIINEINGATPMQ